MELTFFSLILSFFTHGELIYWLAQSAISAFLTAVIAAPLGILISYYSNRKIQYRILLTLLLVPFALGPDIWAFSVDQLFRFINIKNDVIGTNNINRSLIWIFCAHLRSVSLALFVVATTMHSRANKIRSYCFANSICSVGYLRLVSKELPILVVVVSALFTSAIAMDSSLPFYLYRANPGTPPDSINLALLRLFREQYPVLGGHTSMLAVITGFIATPMLLATALIGGISGIAVSRWMLSVNFSAMLIANNLIQKVAVLFTTLYALSPTLVLLALLGEAIAVSGRNLTPLAEAFKFTELIALSIVTGVALTVICMSTIFLARYREKVEMMPNAPSRIGILVLGFFLFFPAVSLSLIAGYVFSMVDAPSWIILMFSHSVLLLPMVVIFCAGIVRSIPEHRFAWFRSNALSSIFLLKSEGIRSNLDFIMSLASMCAIQIITDGVVNRWISNSIPGPAELMAAAAFGRTGSLQAALQISVAISLLAITASAALSNAICYRLEK